MITGQEREAQQKAAAEAQQKTIDERHAKEAEARPDSLHRAVLFLLRCQMVTNRDDTREAQHYIKLLDEEHGKRSKIEELEKTTAPAAPAPAVTAPATPTDQKQQTPEPAGVPVSSRFSRPRGPRKAAPKN